VVVDDPRKDTFSVVPLGQLRPVTVRPRARTGPRSTSSPRGCVAWAAQPCTRARRCSTPTFRCSPASSSRPTARPRR
jgi:hypothetical protein